MHHGKHIDDFEPSPQDQLDTQEDIQHMEEPLNILKVLIEAGKKVWETEHCNSCGSDKKEVGKECNFCRKVFKPEYYNEHIKV